MINKFSEIRGYKIHIQKSVAFLYTNYELSEKETKKTIPFIITSKKLKYLGKFNQKSKTPVLGKL